MSQRALVVGKFYPPHIGHHKLIDLAIEESDHVYVAVCYSRVESIPVRERIAWIEERHPDAIVFPVYDDSPVLYTDETWGLFLNALLIGLGTVPQPRWVGYPNVVYSGESYAPDFARRLYKKLDEEGVGWEEIAFRIVDRMELPEGRATPFRADPPGNWEILAPATKAGMVHRVVVCGPESSGTTTLSKALAKHYDTPWVQEYGRIFDESVGRNHEWTREDFLHIAETQIKMDDDLARRSRRGLLICDTDVYATAMFQEFYLPGSDNHDLLAMATQNRADLYIVTDHLGIPFDDDGTRRFEERQGEMISWFGYHLPANKKTLVGGTHEKRLSRAIKVIDALSWHIEDPIEYR